MDFSNLTDAMKAIERPTAQFGFKESPHRGMARAIGSNTNAPFAARHAVKATSCYHSGMLSRLHYDRGMVTMPLAQIE